VRIEHEWNTIKIPRTPVSARVMPESLAWLVKNLNSIYNNWEIGKKMLPTKVEAMRILESGYKKNPGQWKSHSIIVAKCAYKISSCCRDMNPDKAYILGLLHDIGRQEGVTYIAHVIDGYDFLMKSGYDEAAKICITHSFSIKNILDYNR
jgi:HD superfamily phosphodiesterase